jgi:hypothetical protein
MCMSTFQLSIVATVLADPDEISRITETAVQGMRYIERMTSTSEQPA